MSWLPSRRSSPQQWDNTFTDPDFCGSGITVERHDVGQGLLQVRYGSRGMPFAGSWHGNGTQTLTGPNGAVITITYSHRQRDVSIVDNGDGTYTESYRDTGSPFSATFPNHTRIADHGTVTFVEIWSFNGTPNDPLDDYFRGAGRPGRYPWPASRADLAHLLRAGHRRVHLVALGVPSLRDRTSVPAESFGRSCAMRGTLLIRLSALLAVLGLIAAMANPVAAAKPEKVNQTAGPFPDEVCGIPVTTTVNGFSIFHIQHVVIPSTGVGSDDFWIGVIQDHLTFTHTNAAGVTVTNTVHQTRQEGAIVDNGDGTWTYTYTVNGQPMRLRSGNKTVLMDVGSISFSDVIYLGDLSTDADDYFVGSRITDINGPHPEAESDFTLFCQIFTGIMG